MKIQVQGPDGSGKTTLATSLSQYFDLPYLKFSQSRNVDEVVKVTLEVARDPNYTDCVIDRVKTIDHIIYGSIVEGIKFKPYELRRMHLAQKHLEASTNRYVILYMFADPDVLWERLTARGDETYVTKDHLVQIMEAYKYMFAHRSDVLWMDTSEMTKDQVVRRGIERIEALEDSIYTPY